jgi:hypothetical protein
LGMAWASRIQLSALALYVEHVKCLTPMLAKSAMSFCGWSFTRGMMGSIRTETGMPFLIKSCAALRRCEGVGACGSMSFAMLSSSVVIVNATVAGIWLSKSSSLTTKLLLVIIWILQLLSAKISRHRLVKPADTSARGYGSDELAIEMVSPLSLAASRFSVASRSFLGLQSLKLGI